MHRLLLNPNCRAQTRCILRDRTKSVAGVSQGSNSFKLRQLSAGVCKHHCICMGYLNTVPVCAIILEVYPLLVP